MEGAKRDFGEPVELARSDLRGIVVTTDAGGSRVGTIVIVRPRVRTETGERAYPTARLVDDRAAE